MHMSKEPLAYLIATFSDDNYCVIGSTSHTNFTAESKKKTHLKACMLTDGIIVEFRIWNQAFLFVHFKQ